MLSHNFGECYRAPNHQDDGQTFRGTQSNLIDTYLTCIDEGKEKYSCLRVSRVIAFRWMHTHTQQTNVTITVLKTKHHETYTTKGNQDAQQNT